MTTEERTEILRARARAWYYANRERAMATTKVRRDRFRSDINSRQRAYNREHRGKVNAAKRLFRKLNPWYQSLENAKQRCDNPNNKAFKYYGGRGIRFMLSNDDGAMLWKRDHADLMQRPSLDRINADGDYTLQNCRFLEFVDNVRNGVITRTER